MLSDCLDQILVVKTHFAGNCTSGVRWFCTWGGNSVPHDFALLWCLVPFPAFRGSKAESAPWSQWRFLRRLIFALSAWKEVQTHIWKVKENTTVSDSAFSDHTETSSQEEVQKPSHATWNWSRLRWVAVIFLWIRRLSVLFQTERSLH